MKLLAKRREALVCVDSDGCAMDSMDVKHIRCFGPCLVEQWQLEPWREPVLRRWNAVNLYTATRGVNRFRGLAMVLSEVNVQYTPIAGIAAFAAWTEHAPELSNAAVARQLDACRAAGDAEAGLCFEKALRWSEAVNRAMEALPDGAIGPFSGVREGLQAAHAAADVAVVSSANGEAVRAGWTRFGLAGCTDCILTQDAGTKSHCISMLLQQGYGRQNVLMVGDAIGDLQAARENGVLFYPILARREAASWQTFREEALPRFLHGTYGAVQAQEIRRFLHNLGTEDGAAPQGL